MFGHHIEDMFLVVSEQKASRGEGVYASTETTLERAEKLAKRNAHRYQEDYVIFKACASVEHIIPEMKVTKLVK